MIRVISDMVAESRCGRTDRCMKGGGMVTRVKGWVGRFMQMVMSMRGCGMKIRLMGEGHTGTKTEPNTKVTG